MTEETITDSTTEIFIVDASKIPTLSNCREGAHDSIWKVEIRMKAVTVPEQSNGNGLKK